MNTLIVEQIQEVHGGFIVPIIEAILIGLGVFAAPQIFSDANTYLGNQGRNLSEKTYDYYHPYNPNA